MKPLCEICADASCAYDCVRTDQMRAAMATTLNPRPMVHCTACDEMVRESEAEAIGNDEWCCFLCLSLEPIDPADLWDDMADAAQ